MAYCNLPEKIVGPYNQVLFLGCSVSNFNCNLGWGAEQSTLSVSLVEDKCYHPQSNEYGQVDTKIDTLVQQDDNIQGGNAFYKKSDGSYETNDPTKALHKNMAFEMKSLEDARDTENINLSADFKDYGKICYDINGNRVYWTDPDPMFVGLSGKFHNSGLDILGTPVRFKFNNFSFGGLVSSWKQNGSQGGSRSFEVEIKSFASLLNGCQLIVSKYAGTVCGIVPNTNIPQNPINKDVAMPMPYSIDNSTTPPTFSFFNQNASIEQGNIPNVFNIYGYLEYLGYKNKIYGNAGVTDEGIRAQYIYDALVTLLGPTNENHPDNKSPFSPYGAIISRSVRVNGTAQEQDPLQVKIFSTSIGGSRELNLTHMGICPNGVAIDNYRRCRIKLDLSEVPRPPKWLRMQGPVISLTQFITEVCDGAGFDFFIDFVYPNGEQVAQNISGIIKIRTVSRRKQPKKDQIDQLISYLTNNGGVTSYTKGKEFTDVNTRTMYVGGKQKRLLQLKCTRLAFKQNTLVYDPWANNGNGAMIDYDQTTSLSSTPNQLRMPNTSSTRIYSFKYMGGAAVASQSSTFDTPVYFTTPADSRSLNQGNYFPAVNLAEAQGFIGSIGPIGKNVELFKDTICPYFGVGANGLIRPVYFDKYMGQMQIIFQTADIQNLTSLPLSNFNPYPAAGIATATTSSSPIFLVLEHELRAAGGGFKSWLDYCFGSLFTTDIAEILYKGFRDKYGFGFIPEGSTAMFADLKKEFLTGISLIHAKASQKTIIRNGRPMQVNISDLAPHFQVLYNDLENIHKFFESIASEYYGKQFMVRIPEIAWYRDLSYVYDDNDQKIILGYDEDNNPIYAIEGAGKVYTNYSISTDGAWEEPGNYIDDTMVVGSTRVSAMSDESGKIPCILGFNSSLEKDYSRQWNRQQFLASLATRRFSDISHHCVTDWELVLQKMLSDPDLQDANHYFMSLKHTLSPDEYALLPYIAPTVTINNAHGINLLDIHKYKLYAKATPSSDIQFLSPDYADPRAVVSLSSPVFIGQDKHGVDYNVNSMSVQDSLLRIVNGASLPSIMSSLGVSAISVFTGSTTILGGLGPNPIATALMASSFTAAVRNLQLQHGFAWGERVRVHDSIDSLASDRILPKAAVPMFCALPIEFNDFVYGPWINHPGLIASTIFPDSTDPNIHRLEVENLVGGVKVNVDESLVPWNYGGMTPLDEAVMLRIADEVNYQQTLEMGTVQIPGFDNFSLGDMIKYYGTLFDGPIINSIQVQIGEGGITTTYNFRTYVRKLGLFNKESSERIKAINQEAIKRNKEINTQLMQLSSKIRTFRIL